MSRILDLLFPAVCVGCEQEIPKGALCKTCADTLPNLSTPRCPHCDLRVPSGALAERCRKVLRISKVSAVGPYSHAMLKAAIDALKYTPHLRDIARPLGRSVADTIERQWGALPSPTLLVPIPLHPKREQERGFNQSLLIAEEVARRLRVDVAPNLLKRTAVTQRQVGLSASERKENIVGAFSLVHRPDAAYTYVLIDDVTTTGSTLRECAKTLRAGGARNVYAATVAQG